MTAAEKEYGGALYALAAEEHCEDAVLEGLTLAADAFREMPGYLKLVQNPAVPREERLAMLDEAFGAGVDVYKRQGPRRTGCMKNTAACPGWRP